MSQGQDDTMQGLGCGRGCTGYQWVQGVDGLGNTVGYWQPTHEWAAEKAKCTRYTFVVSNCSVTAVRLFSPSGEKRHLDYFTFANWGGESVAFVRSTKDPSVITLRNAADGLFGRWMFFLVLVALGAVLALASLARPRVPRADPTFT